MSVALGLLRLQQVDSRLSQVNGRLESIRATLENDTELAAAGDDLRRREAEYDALEKERRTEEYEAQSQRAKIQQAESSLYGGSVRNPKELQELQADISSLKKQLTVVEERELDSMVRLEAAESALRVAQQQLDAVQVRLKASHSRLIQDQESLLLELRDAETERQAAQSAIPATFLAIYESLRGARRGLAVAEVSDNACSACGTSLTAALQQSARHAAELVYCPACGRILYAG